MIQPAQTDEFAQLRAQLQHQQEQLAAQQARLAHLERLRRRPRRRTFAHLGAALAVAFLVALAPLSLFAANGFLDLDQAQDGPTGHNANIDLIYNAGITVGCGGDPTTYCPKDNVTREQMATFLAKTAGLGPWPAISNAKTAQTATNATQLGGVAAADYARKAQFVPAEVMANVIGPLPKSASFTTSGGSVLLFVSGSAFRTGSAGDMGMRVLVDGTFRGIVQVNTNTVNSHDDFIPRTLVLTSLAAGPHTITLEALNGTVNGIAYSTTTNSFDYYSVSTLELP